MTIDFSLMTQFLGRNGYFNCKGVSINQMRSPGSPVYASDTVRIYPITSKGEDGRCFVEIPEEDLPEVIAALQSLARGGVDAVVGC